MRVFNIITAVLAFAVAAIPPFNGWTLLMLLVGGYCMRDAIYGE